MGDENPKAHRNTPAQPHGGVFSSIQLSGVPPGNLPFGVPDAQTGRFPSGNLDLTSFLRTSVHAAFPFAASHFKVDFPPLSYNGTLVFSSFIRSFAFLGVSSYRVPPIWIFLRVLTSFPDSPVGCELFRPLTFHERCSQILLATFLFCLYCSIDFRFVNRFSTEKEILREPKNFT